MMGWLAGWLAGWLFLKLWCVRDTACVLSLRLFVVAVLWLLLDSGGVSALEYKYRLERVWILSFLHIRCLLDAA